MRNQKGITLVALVVTIVVLLILAGVSIAMLSGDNGIITNAKDASAASTEGDVIDRMNLAYNSLRAEVLAKSSVNENYDATTETNLLKLANQVAKELGGNGTEVTALGTAATVNTNYKVTCTAAGLITISYTDTRNFGDGEKYSAIDAEITVANTDVTYSNPPSRQVNVEDTNS